jgi:hypothetical protein
MSVSRIEYAKPNGEVSSPRVATFWIKYDWATLDLSTFFVRPDKQNLPPEFLTTEGQQKVYRCQVEFPVFDDSEGIVEVNAESCYDEDYKFQPDVPIDHQVARTLFCGSAHSFCPSAETPVHIRWDGSPFDHSTNSFMVQRDGKVFEVTVRELKEAPLFATVS